MLYLGSRTDQYNIYGARSCTAKCFELAATKTHLHTNVDIFYEFCISLCYQIPYKRKLSENEPLED